MKRKLVEIGKRMYDKNLIAGYEGNISAKINDKIYITPSGVCKGFLKEDDILEIDMQGKVLSGNGKPSSETKMHLTVYNKRHDVNAVVHAHPPVSTGFACSGRGLDQSLTAETVLLLGSIPLAPYGTPSTNTLAESIVDYLQYNAILLANHGAMTLGHSLDDAYFLMEQVEHYAKITLTANILGTPKTLPCDEVDRLMKLREKFGIKTGEPLVCERKGQIENYRFSKDELVELIHTIYNEIGGK